jgi:hypothetical protein
MQKLYKQFYLVESDGSLTLLKDINNVFDTAEIWPTEKYKPLLANYHDLRQCEEDVEYGLCTRCNHVLITDSDTCPKCGKDWY